MTATFKKNILDTYGEAGKIWLKNLPEIVNQAKETYGLSKLAPVNNLSYHYVLSGSQGHLPIILKLGFDSQVLHQEALALNAFTGLGAIKVLAQAEGLLLLERAVPGTPLTSYFPSKDNATLPIFCKVMKRLHTAPISGAHFPTVKEWLSALDRNWEIPIHYLEKARKLKDSLLATASSPVLLHGDLHQDNILENGNEWVVIDPKGVIGEPAYEIAAFIRNPLPALPDSEQAKDIIEGRILYFSKTLHLTRERISAWCFVQAVLSWIWAVEDNSDTKLFETLTNIFDRL